MRILSTFVIRRSTRAVAGLFVSSLSLGVLIACGSEGVAVIDGGVDGMTRDAAPDTSLGDADIVVVCNSNPSLAPFVTSVSIAQDLPYGATGGTIVDGTYFLTGIAYYSGSGVDAGYSLPVISEVATWVIEAGVAQVVGQTQIADGGISGVVHATFALGTKGNSITLEVLCPVVSGNPTFTASYGVTDAGFVEISTVGPWSAAETYTRQ